MTDTSGVHDPVEGPIHLHWRNLTAPLLLEAFWCTGLVLLSRIVVTALLDELNASGLAIGLAGSVMPLASMCVQPFVAFYSLRLSRRKRWCYGLEGIASLLYLTLGLMLLLLARDTLLANGVYLFFAIYIPLFFFMNAGSSMYYGLLLDLTPKLKRGRLFGWRTTIGAGAGMLGGKLIEPLLEGFGIPVPNNYGVPFVLGGICWMIGAHTLLLFNENVMPPRSPTNSSSSMLHFWLDEIIPLLKERVFRRVMLMRILMGISFACMTFLTLFYKRQSETHVAETLSRFAFTFSAAMLVGALFNGRIADRIGYRFLMTVACLCSVLAYIVPLASSDRAYAVISFVLLGYAHSVLLVGIIPFVRELVPGHDSLKLVATSWFIVAPFMVAGQLLLGRTLDWTDYYFPIVFIAALSSGTVALCICLFGLHEPRKTGSGASVAIS